MLGKIINNYVINRVLGDGGMGTVYYARHNKIDREVAIKILHSNLFGNDSIRGRFKNEAMALIKLNHPNIVKIYDYVEQDNLACLLIEYINGIPLDQYIAKTTGPLSESKAISIMNSVLDAVGYAHENNIYHRDIKPGNIMIANDSNIVKIMDFGIAKLNDSSNFDTTVANLQLGTPFYMSPEQVEGTLFTVASDIYSLGVTLFEMVTGRCPYREISNLFVLQSKIVNEPLPSTDRYYPHVTDQLQDAIKIATHKDPKQRFQSCAEFKKYLLDKHEPIKIAGEAKKKTPAAKQEEYTQSPEVSESPAFVSAQEQPVKDVFPAAFHQTQLVSFEPRKKNNVRIYFLAGGFALITAIVLYFIFSHNPSPSQQRVLSLDSIKVRRQVDSLIMQKDILRNAAIGDGRKRKELTDSLFPEVERQNKNAVSDIVITGTIENIFNKFKDCYVPIAAGKANSANIDSINIARAQIFKAKKEQESGITLTPLQNSEYNNEIKQRKTLLSNAEYGYIWAAIAKNTDHAPSAPGLSECIRYLIGKKIKGQVVDRKTIITIDNSDIGAKTINLNLQWDDSYYSDKIVLYYRLNKNTKKYILSINPEQDPEIY